MGTENKFLNVELSTGSTVAVYNEHTSIMGLFITFRSLLNMINMVLSPVVKMLSIFRTCLNFRYGIETLAAHGVQGAVSVRRILSFFKNFGSGNKEYTRI